MDTFKYSGVLYFQEPDFPLSVVYWKQHGTEPHEHDFHELVIVRNGVGQHVTDNFTHRIARGDVLVLPPLLRHYYTDVHKLDLINILFAPESLRVPLLDLKDIPGYYVLFEAGSALLKKGVFKSRLILDIEQLANVEKIVANLHGELCSHPKGYHFTASAYFMELISYLSRCYTSQDNKISRRLFRVSAMINFIEKNFRKK